ncbi:DNA glycosylase, partial [Coniophora puteana RWD-64-598 SS2]
SPSASQATKKLKLLSDFSSTSPFPNFTAPSTEDVNAIYDLLASTFPNGAAPKHRKPLDSANSGATCGATPNVLDSLIGTILSQNTSNANSSSAKNSLDAAFGRGEKAFAKMATAPAADVVEAIKHGGLANRKARIIQNLLVSVKEAHPEGRYDLQHLLAGDVSDEEVMRSLVQYNGVGPKTAACVLAFCMGRDAFAVDTHVFRITRMLGWVPRHADRVSTQAHLELRVPPELKYGLHVMFVKHGRACKGCKNGSRGECPLKTWMKEKGIKVEEVEE